MVRRFWVLMVSFAALLLGLPPAGVIAQAPESGGHSFVPVVAMSDQFEKHHDVAEHRGDVVVLIYGDRKSAEANRLLGEQIHVHFHPAAKGQSAAQARQAPVRPIDDLPAGTRAPDVLAVPVACVGKVPALVQRVIRGQVRGGSPDVAVWLDFQDAMKGQFAFQAGVPNVVVLDPQGRFRYAAGGQPTPAGTGHLLEVIEALRREAVGLR
jgi:hypothetical protein